MSITLIPRWTWEWFGSPNAFHVQGLTQPLDGSGLGKVVARSSADAHPQVEFADGESVWHVAVSVCRRFCRCVMGATAIEFAIISPVMILLSLGTVELGRGLHERNRLSFLADMAAREVMINPNVLVIDLKKRLLASFTGTNPDLLQIETTLERDEMLFREITISYSLELLLPNLSGDQIILSVSRRVPVECSTLELSGLLELQVC